MVIICQRIKYVPIPLVIRFSEHATTNSRNIPSVIHRLWCVLVAQWTLDSMMGCHACDWGSTCGQNKSDNIICYVLNDIHFISDCLSATLNDIHFISHYLSAVLMLYLGK